MALNIGSLVGYLELDDRQFTRKAEAADKKLSALKLHLEALSKSDPKIKVQVETEVAKIDALQAKIAELKAQAARGIDVRVDMVRAMVELDAIQAKVRSLHGKEIRVDVDTKTARQNVSALGTAIALLGPTIGPVAASATGMSVAIGSVFAAGVGGLALWAKVAQSAAKETLRQQKAIDAAKKKADEATDPKKKAAAMAEYQSLLDGLSKRQARFVENQGKMREAWGKLTSSQSVFGPMNKGMLVLASILPKLRPLLDAVSRSLTGVVTDVGKWVDSGGFDRFIKGFTVLAGPSITIGLRTLGNFAKGFAGMGKAFGPLGLQMAGGLERMSASFAKWGNNSAGLQQFVAYVSVEGPKLIHLLGDVTEALVHLGIATAPVGGVILSVLSAVARGISAIPIPLLMPLASGLVAVNIALKALAITTNMANALGMEKTASALGNMSKLKFAGVAMGLGAMTASASSSNKALGLLGSVAGGALIGFQVGGPWGAAIGAGAGALFNLATNTMKSGDAMKDAAGDADNFAASLRGVRAAASDATRAEIVSSFQKSGVLKTGNDLGLTNRQITNAATGNRGAQDKAAAAADARRAQLKAQMDAAKADFRRLMAVPPMEQSPDFGKQYDAAQKAMQKSISSYKSGTKALNEFTAAVAHDARTTKDEAATRWAQAKATDGYAKALNMVPKDVRTQFEALNVAPTVASVVGLLTKYGKTPDEIRTVLSLLGTDVSIERIDRVRAKQAKVDRLIPITINVKADAARAALAGIQATINAMHGTSVPITVTRHTNANVAEVAPKRANGGPISGPGSGTSDSIVARVSNGEFIVNARATKQHLPLLYAINAGDFAKGGKIDAKRGRARKRGLLDQYSAMLAATDTKISDAQGFGSAFAGNAFAQGFTGASGAMSSPYAVNGSMVSTSTGPSSAGILEQMFAYQAAQLAQAHALEADVGRLRGIGVSDTLIEQMKAAGASGLSQIHALAGGPADKVREFNARAVETQAALSNAGALGVSGKSMSDLQKQRVSEASMVKAMREVLKRPVKVEVANDRHLRTNG